MKTCRLCGEDKQEDDFYLSPKHSCGRDSKCKACAREAVKSARARNAEHYKEYDKARYTQPQRVADRIAYRKSESGKKSHRQANVKYYDANPKRRAANLAVSRAIRDGRLQKLPCFVCGETVVEGPHPDYDRHLDVVWLCVKHHKELHWDHYHGVKNEQST